MKALQLSPQEFDEAVKPNGLLYLAIKQGLDPEILIDHQNKVVVVALDDALSALMKQLGITP